MTPKEDLRRDVKKALCVLFHRGIVSDIKLDEYGISGLAIDRMCEKQVVYWTDYPYSPDGAKGEFRLTDHGFEAAQKYCRERIRDLKDIPDISDFDARQRSWLFSTRYHPENRGFVRPSQRVQSHCVKTYSLDAAAYWAMAYWVIGDSHYTSSDSRLGPACIAAAINGDVSKIKEFGWKLQAHDDLAFEDQFSKPVPTASLDRARLIAKYGSSTAWNPKYRGKFGWSTVD